MSRLSKKRFLAIVEPELRALRRTAYRLCRDPVDADDLVQRVCLRAFERAEDLKGVASPRAWLLRVQHNLFVDDCRRRSGISLEAFDDASDAAISTVWPDPDTAAATTERIEALDRAWPELTADQRALLALYAEGHDLKTLAGITDLPLSALKARLHRARVRLGKLLAAADTAPRQAIQTGDRR